MSATLCMEIRVFMCISLSPGMGVPSVLVAPGYGASVCSEGCV